MVGLASTLNANLDAADASAQELIQRVIALTSHEAVAVRAIRELRAGTRSGKHQGWMDVETMLSPSGAFTWNVIEEGGSERTRNKIFRELLQSEAASWRDGSQEAAALTLENYEFHALNGAPAGHLKIQLKPRRSDPRLIDGTLTVSADGYPLRLEGRLAKSPSFWVKSVTIIKSYGRFGGVALPIAIESCANVKMVGESTFTMRYRYSEVNGRSVPLLSQLVAGR